MIINGKENAPYLIAEIGINHSGDMQIVKKLIDAAFACGWDCVKFQKRNPDLCVPEDQKNKEKDTPWGKMTYLEYKKRMELTKEQYDYIDKYCKEKPIDWSASVWDLDSLNFLLQYDVPFIKIPSALLTNNLLLAKAAESGKQIILSTGMSTFDEIEDAIDMIFSYSKINCPPLILLHTNSSYPAPKSELNLNVITAFKNTYNSNSVVIGYSGHEEDLEPSVIAVALGAKVIERHITLSHDMWGTDQKASLEVMGMDVLKKRIADISIILGDYNKIVTPSEVSIRAKLRK